MRLIRGEGEGHTGLFLLKNAVPDLQIAQIKLICVRVQKIAGDKVLTVRGVDAPFLGFSPRTKRFNPRPAFRPGDAITPWPLSARS